MELQFELPLDGSGAAFCSSATLHLKTTRTKTVVTTTQTTTEYSDRAASDADSNTTSYSDRVASDGDSNTIEEIVPGKRMKKVNRVLVIEPIN